jgi:hypothetical protein
MQQSRRSCTLCRCPVLVAGSIWTDLTQQGTRFVVGLSSIALASQRGIGDRKPFSDVTGPKGVRWCHHQLGRAVDPLARSLWVPQLVPAIITFTDLARGRSLPPSCSPGQCVYQRLMRGSKLAAVGRERVSLSIDQFGEERPSLAYSTRYPMSLDEVG